MSRRYRYVYAALIALVCASCAGTSVLYEGRSHYSTIIVTERPDGVRTLLFGHDGALQSVVKPGDPDYLELAYTRTALAGLALCGEPRRLLVVGLGGGTLPMFLHRHYPRAVIDVVEIDPAVVEVARRFFGFRDDDRLRVHVADGRRYIEQAGASTYDAIFLDAFGGSSVPAHLTTVEFLRAVRRAVKPDGVVIGNVWKATHNRLYGAMRRTYQDVFDALYILDVQGDVNTIFLALPRRQAIDEAGLAQKAQRLSAQRGFGFDLGDAVRGHFEAAQVRDSAARVLRDSGIGRE